MFYNSIDCALMSGQYFLLALSPCCNESGGKRALIDRSKHSRWPEVTCRELASTPIKARGFAGPGTWQSMLPSHSKMQAEAQQKACLPSIPCSDAQPPP